MAKGGKWDYLRGKYPKVPIEGTWQEKLDAIMSSPAPKEVLGPGEDDLELPVSCLSDFQLARLYKDARAKADRLTEELKQLSLEIEAYTRTFVARFEEAGESSKTFEDGMSIGVSIEPYPIVKEPDKLLAWIKETGQEALLSLNYQTMASMVKTSIEEGKPLPPGVDAFLKDKLTCRGRK